MDKYKQVLLHVFVSFFTLIFFTTEGFSQGCDTWPPEKPPDANSPDPPDHLTANPGDGAVELSWDQSDSATGYIVFYTDCFEPEAFSIFDLDHILVDTNTIIITGLINNKSYQFKVVSYSGILPLIFMSALSFVEATPVPAGGSFSTTSSTTQSMDTTTTTTTTIPVTQCGEVNIWPPDPPQADSPPHPSIISVLAGDGFVTLTWEEGTQADGYYVFYTDCTSGVVKNLMQLPYITTNNHSVTITSLSNDTPYEFKVYSFRDFGPVIVLSVGSEVIEVTPPITPVSTTTTTTTTTIPFSPIATTTTLPSKCGEVDVWPISKPPQPGAPAAPQNLTGVTKNGRILFTWDPVPGADGYYVFYTDCAGPKVNNLFDLNHVETVSNSVTITGLINGMAYEFKAVSYKGAGLGKILSSESEKITASPAFIAGTPSAAGLSTTTTIATYPSSQSSKEDWCSGYNFDVNGDGEVNVLDAALIMRYIKLNCVKE